MRRWTTGVTVVSVKHKGISHGMTVSSFTSVSLNPETIIISLMKTSRTHDMIINNLTFGISLLSGHQQAISERFAGQSTELEDRFDGLETFTLVTGAPLLKGGLAFLDCKLITVHGFGMNSLLVGEVLAAKVGNRRKPLVYFDQRYHKLQE
jgi:flavin reductase (DIM6/NTAB) family NADH-FMN oxidoreductase RutF